MVTAGALAAARAVAAAATRTAVASPRCGSRDTARTSASGTTACTALHRCENCREPFE